MSQMTLSKFAAYTAAIFRSDAHLVPVAWSAPGIGKSSVIRQVVDRLSEESGERWGLIDLRLSQLDPVDLRGVPTVENGVTVWNVPEFLPNAERDGERGVLFLDEVFLAAPAVQAAAMQLVLDRRVGDYVLPEGWKIACASNRASDKAGVGSTNKALDNRFIHVDVIHDVDEWCGWAAEAGLPAELVAFLRFRSELLHQYPDGGIPRGARAFATPRTWAMAASILELDLDDDTQHAALQGAVGEGPASELIGFLRICRTLPDIGAVLRDPNGADVPLDPATQYATAACLARRVDRDTLANGVTFAERMAPEFAVLLLRDATARDPNLKATEAYIDFKVKHSAVNL